MRILTLLTLFLLCQKGSLRNTGHLIDRDAFEEALLENLDFFGDTDNKDFSYNDDNFYNEEDAFRKILDAINKEVKYHQKRHVPRVKDYEIYDDNDYHKSVKKHQDHKHKSLKWKKLQDEKHNKRSHVAKKELLKKEYSSSSNGKNKLKENNDAVATVVQAPKKISDNDDDEITKMQKDNNQVAIVNVDDTVERQKEFVSKLNAKEIFLEPNLDAANNTKDPPKTPARIVATKKKVVKKDKGLNRASFIAIIAGCAVAGIAGIALATYCWLKLRENLKDDGNAEDDVLKNTSESEAGVKENKKDEDLVRSAEMFHYLHAKKQIKQMEEPDKTDEKHASEETDDEDENTVYECPGLAPPGDMKVVNPLFSDAESHHSDKQSDGVSPEEQLEELNKPPIK